MKNQSQTMKHNLVGLGVHKRDESSESVEALYETEVTSS